MTPQAFYRGLLKDMRTHLGEPKTFCAYPVCGKPFTINGDEYCSDACGEDHDTAQKGGTPLPEHERCTCAGRTLHPHLVPPERHGSDCPCYVPHPEDYTHPLENE
jgi:hypothetical protein